MTVKKLALVDSVSICMVRDCMLSFSITVNYEGRDGFGGFKQDVGALIIDSPNPNKRESSENSHDIRIGTSEAAELIRRLFLFFGVNDLSNVKNQYIYVIAESDSYSARILGIENISVEQNSNRLKSIIYSDIFKEDNTIDDLCNRYEKIIIDNYPGASPKCIEGNEVDACHILWMIEMVRNNTKQSITKKHRWIGYIQGILSANSLIDVLKERDITRSILNGA